MEQNTKNAPLSPDYEVGYGRPPVHTRFKKGQSGNPSGRARRSPLEAQINADLLKELARPVTLRQDGEVVRVPASTALIRSALANALKGNGPNQRHLLNFIQQIQAATVADNKELLRIAIEAKHKGEQEIARRQRLGITDTSDIVPHPDRILIDHQTGEVTILEHPWPEHLARFANEQATRAREAEKERTYRAPGSPAPERP